MLIDQRDFLIKNNNTICPDDTWIPADQTVTIAGREIQGMVYIGTRVDGISGKYDDSVIDPDLPVDEFNSKINPKIGQSKQPWAYGSMDTTQRAIYLEWLATDRSADGFHEGYILLYILGLERRFFIDSPTERECDTLLFEAKRLLEQYRGHYLGGTIEKLLSKFIYTANAIRLPSAEIEPHYSDIQMGGKTPLDIGVAMKNKMETGQPLNHQWFLVLYLLCSGKKLPAPVERALSEFLVILGQLFEKKFPDGLPIPMVTGEIHPKYEAHEQVFTVDLLRHFGKIPDLSTISSLNEEAIELIDQASKIIYDYGRYLATDEYRYSPLVAYKRLPERIKPYCLPPGLKELKIMVEEAMSSNEDIPIIDLLKVLNLDKTFRLYPTQVKKVSQSLKILSYGMAPDPIYEWEGSSFDTPYAIFKLPQDQPWLTEMSNEYQESIMYLLAGFIVGHAREPIHPDAVKILDSYVQSTHLVEEERIRLNANLRIMRDYWPTIQWYRDLVKKTPESLFYPSSVEIAFRIATIDGDVTDDQITVLKGIYKSLKIPVKNVLSDLQSFMH